MAQKGCFANDDDDNDDHHHDHDLPDRDLTRSKYVVGISFIRRDKVAHQQSTNKTRFCNSKTAPEN
jgi:hypothetical protein